MTSWARDPRVLWRRVGDGLVLLPPEGSECLLVGGSAEPVWRHLEQATTCDDLVAEVAAEYGMDPSEIAGPVRQALDMLADHRAVVGG